MSKKQSHGSAVELRMCDLYNLSLGYSLRPVLILDIRSSEEYNDSHCFGAASVPVNARAVEAALEAGMSTPESSALELYNLINAQLQRPPEHVAGLFDGVFNRKLVHHERFLDREHSIVCVYGNHALPPSSPASPSPATPPSDAASMPIAKRVASAIALYSSADFTCFYMSDAFDSFRQAYAFAVQTDSWRQPLEGAAPEGAAAPRAEVIVEDDGAAEHQDEVIIEDNGAAEHRAEVIIEDNGAGVTSAPPPSAAEFNFKGCPPLCDCPCAFSLSINCLHLIA